ncbi:SIR2 family NAD-dependent protein deacylase [Anaeromicrobium sediminis]|uniref:protein acetyllysine N-acetyltransferase n=1 Tax=Anaeromicrobium sediminis TaxID=1478221 RepID=A0A267MKZ5_9FIRM|nr:NAD-dependent protein deacylase [Anaeromicrobium sediminis]PAB59450.1 NAD-dependent deacetylase [Anaeromicrobium sediminis]
MDKIDKLVHLMKNSKKTIVLTGAGISTESGIPDFRSSTGLWAHIDPMEALSTDVLYNNPNKFYKEGFELLTGMTNAEPNIGHFMLAKLENEGFVDLLITQNIDNLHQRAGSKNIYEVHGNTREGYCTDCGEKVVIEHIKDKVKSGQVPPVCHRCGGILRPSVVMFGDGLPECFDKGWREVEKSELLIVIGSSLSVSPVNYLANICENLAIINLGETMYDYKAKIIINEKIGETLKTVYDRLNK